MDNGNRWKSCIPQPWPPKGPFPGIPPQEPGWPYPDGPRRPRPYPPNYPW